MDTDLTIWEYNGLQLELDMQDVDTMKRYHEAFAKMGASEKSMIGSFSAMIATGGNLYVTETANDSFSMKADLAAGELLGAIEMVDSAEADTSGVVQFCLADTLSDIFSTMAAGSEDITLSCQGIDGLDERSYMSFNEYVSLLFADAFSNSVYIGANYHQPPIVMSAIVDAQVTSIQFDVDYVSIDMTLQPGQTLVIDSDNFVVLHDGVDSIETHAGVWPMLTREVFDIQVSSGAVADLVTNILYTDRYL